MGLWWGLFVIIVIALVVRLAGSRLFGGPSERSPETILKERYARGEINKEQYEEMLQELRR